MTDTIKLTLAQQNPAWKKAFEALTVKDIIPINQEEEIAFYHLDTVNHPTDKAQFLHGYHSFTVDHVISVLGIEDSRFAAEGMQKLCISTALSPEKTLHHIEAKVRFESLLNAITAAGWERCITPTQPRLSGYDAFLYAQMQDINYSIDAGYTLPLDEWMLLENQSKWLFYAKGLYLSVTLMRENKEVGMSSGYFITLDILNRASYQRKYQQPYQNELHPHHDLDAEQTLYQQIREQKELEIKNYGEFKLDMNFICPDDHS